jgi:hypothetical protein
MPYRRLVIAALWCICMAWDASAQEFSAPAKPALLSCDSLHPIDMVSIGENPAWLFQRERIIPLRVNVTQQSSSGGLRKPFVPANSTAYQYYVEGQKQISEDHVVEGAFGVVQEFRGNWMWMDTRAYDTGNPFLIADSGTGTTEYHGIVLNGSYSGRWWDDVFVGARLRYGVGSAVKRVSPKPVEVYRDFGMTLGCAYAVSRSVSLGASLLVGNGKEENDFTADQTTSQSQTIIYKFRGIDSYQRYTKNTENRVNDMESYGGRVHASLATDALAGTVYGGARVRSSTVTDGGTSPVKQGYWQSEIVEGAGAMTFTAGRVTVTAIADGRTDHQWTGHPDFNVVLLEQRLTDARCGAMLAVPLSPIEVFAGYTLTLHSRTIDDYAGNITADLSSMMHTGILGMGAGITNDVALQLWYAGDVTRPSSTGITVPTPSLMYAFVGQYDLGFETASVFTSSIGITLTVNGGLLGICTIDGVCHFANAQSSSVFANASRSTVEIHLSTQF